MAERELTSLPQRSQAASWTRWSLFGLVLAGVALWDSGHDRGWLEGLGHVLGWVTTAIWLGALATVWAVAAVRWVRWRLGDRT